MDGFPEAVVLILLFLYFKQIFQWKIFEKYNSSSGFQNGLVKFAKMFASGKKQKKVKKWKDIMNYVNNKLLIIPRRCNNVFRFHSLEGYFLSIFRQAVGKDFEPPRGGFEYESDGEETGEEPGVKIGSRTSVVVKVVDEEGESTAVVDGMNAN